MRTVENKNLYMHSYSYMMKFYEYSCKKQNEWKIAGLLHDRDCPICKSNDTALILDRSDVDCSKFHKCLKCEFVYLNPGPPEEYYNELYVFGYDGIDEWHFKERHAHGDAGEAGDLSYLALEWIKERKEKGLFLDFGCGRGEMLSKAQDTYDVYGIDLDDFRIKKARERLGDFEGRRIINIRELDESSFRGKFDILYSNQTVEHLLEPMHYMKKFYGWLKPGGILYLSCPSSDSFAFSFLGTRNSMASLAHVSLFNRKSLTYALQSMGFEQIQFSHKILDLSAIEFWKRLFNIDFLHRHLFIDSKVLIFALYPLMLATTLALQVLASIGILKGNYFYAFAKKPEK